MLSLRPPGSPSKRPEWFALPATSQLTLSTGNLMKHDKKTSGPFDFLAVAQAAYPGLLRCCDAPRSACTLFRDPTQWAQQRWRCLSCGHPIDPFLANTEEPVFQTYRRIVTKLSRSIELKRLAADGSEARPFITHGLTMPRPVEVRTSVHVGKELIVDPTDSSEELTAEELRKAGVNRVAAEARVSRSRIQAFLNQGKGLQPRSIAKIEAALQRLERAT